MTKAVKEIQSKLPALMELEAIIGDHDVALFFASYLKHNRVAWKAYKELHPEVTEGSARTLGARVLSKVDKGLVMAAYGLDLDAYITQLKEGMAATRFVDDGEGIVAQPDHKVRRDYHKALGQLIGVEGPEAQTNIQVNVNKATDDWTNGMYEEAEVVDEK